LLGQFNLNQNNKSDQGYKFKRYFKRISFITPSSLVCFCFVLGLLVGIGSTFANNREISPHSIPVDERPNQITVKEKNTETAIQKELEY
jgi:hypothetical protein